MRIRDPIWDGILQHMRTGDCTVDDLMEICKLVLTNPACDISDFNSLPWNDTVLVTSCNSIRSRWNNLALKKHCCTNGHTHYVLVTYDHINDTPLAVQECLAIAHMKPDETNRLPNMIEMAVGMKAMVLLNMAMDADLANGSRGSIVDIILDPREKSIPDNTNTIFLTYPPSVILFAPLHSNHAKLCNLPDGVVPIFPS